MPPVHPAPCAVIIVLIGLVEDTVVFLFLLFSQRRQLTVGEDPDFCFRFPRFFVNVRVYDIDFPTWENLRMLFLEAGLPPSLFGGCGSVASFGTPRYPGNVLSVIRSFLKALLKVSFSSHSL